MDNEISETSPKTQKSRIERWAKNGLYFGFAIALLDRKRQTNPPITAKVSLLS